MNEITRPISEMPGAPGAGSGLFDGDTSTNHLVNVSCGPHDEMLPVDGMSAGEVRRRFGDRMDIDPNAQAVLNGQEVGDETIIRTGQYLMFTRRAGEKGKNAFGFIRRHLLSRVCDTGRTKDPYGTA